MLQKVFKMTEVKLKIGRLLLIGIDTNQITKDLHILIRVALTRDLMVKQPLMKMYKAIK